MPWRSTTGRFERAAPRPGSHFLTLFVYASFCDRPHAAGYGAWAKKAIPGPRIIKRSLSSC